jgi:hypothetical protein
MAQPQQFSHDWRFFYPQIAYQVFEKIRQTYGTGYFTYSLDWSNTGQACKLLRRKAEC